MKEIAKEEREELPAVRCAELKETFLSYKPLCVCKNGWAALAVPACTP